jgi:Raf kinase inhibitor-like YbhB/YbcL family protein
MRLTSPAFHAWGAIPSRYTCEGADVSPELAWFEAPAETKCFVLILQDPDAPPADGFAHWLVYNIPPSVTRIQEDVPRQATVTGLGLQGRNSGGTIGYMGPCPPSETHRYFFWLYALRRRLDLGPGASYEDLRSAMSGFVIIEEAELVGTYTQRRRIAA